MKLYFHYNGIKVWWFNGKVHREDGPAYEGIFTEEWFLNGKRHREDGPAIELKDGTQEWWLNGEHYGHFKPENWNDLIQLSRVEMIMES